MNLRRRTANLRRPERARNEGCMGPKRLDDTRRTTYERRINSWQRLQFPAFWPRSESGLKVKRVSTVKRRPWQEAPCARLFKLHSGRDLRSGLKSRAQCVKVASNFSWGGPAAYFEGPHTSPRRQGVPSAGRFEWYLTECIYKLALESQLPHKMVLTSCLLLLIKVLS